MRCVFGKIAFRVCRWCFAQGRHARGANPLYIPKHFDQLWWVALILAGWLFSPRVLSVRGMECRGSVVKVGKSSCVFVDTLGVGDARGECWVRHCFCFPFFPVSFSFSFSPAFICACTLPRRPDKVGIIMRRSWLGTVFLRCH